MLPPNALSKYVEHSNVLQVLGREVKSLLPISCQCPFCPGTLTVYSDPIVSSWYHCPACNFAGDSIDLYKQARNISDSHTAVQSMVKEGIKFNITPSTEIINNYDLGIPTVIKRGRTFWEAAKAEMSGTAIAPHSIDLLHKYCIYSGWSQISWPDKLGRWIGSTTFKMLNDYDIVDHHTKKRWNNALVMPLYDVPGRIRGFTFLSNRTLDMLELNIREGGDFGYSDGGLMFLDAITGSDTVFALGNSLSALQLHIKNFTSSNKPIPVIAFNENTKFAWDCLVGRRVILWDYDINPALIRHATRLFRADISPRPQFAKPFEYQSIYEAFRRRRPVSEITETMLKHAKPWNIVLKDHLLSLPTATAALFLEQVELEPQDKDKLIDCCTAAEKAKIKLCFDGAVIEQERIYGRSVVVEKPDGYYLRTFCRKPHGGLQKDDKRISNVKIDVEQAIRYPHRSETIYSGKILVNGRALPFDDLTESDTDNIFQWISRRILDSGIGYPQVVKEWEKRLFSLAVTMQVPVVRKGIDFVGRENNGICLPTVMIKEGEIIPHDRKTISTKALPLSKVPAPSESDEVVFDNLLTDTAANKNFWAILSIVISDLLTGISVPILLSTKTPLAKNSILSFFTDTLELPLRRAIAGNKLHHVPDILKLEGHDETYKLLSAVKNGHPLPAICDVGIVPFIAGSLFPKSSVIFLEKDQNELTNNFDEILPVLPRYLAWVQNNPFTVTPYTKIGRVHV